MISPKQQEIVRRVKTLFALADQIESRFAQVVAAVVLLGLSLLNSGAGESGPATNVVTGASILADMPYEKVKAADMLAST